LTEKGEKGSEKDRYRGMIRLLLVGPEGSYQERNEQTKLKPKVLWRGSDP